MMRTRKVHEEKKSVQAPKGSVKNLVSHIRQGKLKGLGLVESIHVAFNGWKDAHHNLPFKRNDNVWSSPFMDKDIAAYKEACQSIWEKCETELSDQYAKISLLTKKISVSERELKEAASCAPPAPSEDDLQKRYRGEEDLSNDQISRRRCREYQKRVDLHRQQTQAILETYEKQVGEMEFLHSQIEAVNNVKRLDLERLRNHLEQRRALYWNTAYPILLGSSPIPVCPDPLPKLSTDILYLSQHQDLENDVAAMIARQKKIHELYQSEIESQEENISKRKENAA
ncbi:MAG: hypothetical protein ACI4ET_06625 [Bilifractor sp.]